MLTTRRPRRVPNSTAPATSANRVSSPPRPTPLPGWKWVPRWRTMISPALTVWPPYRSTPRPSCVPFRVLRCLGAVLRSEGDVGDLDLGVLLTVTLALLVPGLVLVLLDDDLRALGGAEHLDGHGGLVERLRVGGDGLAIDGENDGKGQRLAHLGRHLVDLDDVAHGNLLLLGACAHDRVHRGLLRRSLAYVMVWGCRAHKNDPRTVLDRASRGTATQREARTSAPRVNSTDRARSPQNGDRARGPAGVAGASALARTLLLDRDVLDRVAVLRRLRVGVGPGLRDRGPGLDHTVGRGLADAAGAPVRDR